MGSSIFAGITTNDVGFAAVDSSGWPASKVGSTFAFVSRTRSSKRPPTGRYRERVAWLRRFRGIDMTTAMIIVAELHGVERFDSPRTLAAYVGLVAQLHDASVDPMSRDAAWARPSFRRARRCAPRYSISVAVHACGRACALRERRREGGGASRQAHS